MASEGMRELYMGRCSAALLSSSQRKTLKRRGVKIRTYLLRLRFKILPQGADKHAGQRGFVCYVFRCTCGVMCTCDDIDILNAEPRFLSPEEIIPTQVAHARTGRAYLYHLV